MANYIKCPFCGEDDFDLEGLKGHLEHGDCDVYNKTTIQTRLFSGILKETPGLPEEIEFIAKCLDALAELERKSDLGNSPMTGAVDRYILHQQAMINAMAERIYELDPCAYCKAHAPGCLSDDKESPCDISQFVRPADVIADFDEQVKGGK